MVNKVHTSNTRIITHKRKYFSLIFLFNSTGNYRMYSLIGNQWPSNCQKKTISSAANQKAWMHGPDHHQAVNRVSRLYHFNML